MTAKERQLLGRLHGCLNAMSGLQPRSPADTAAASKNLRLSAKAADNLAAALDYLGHQEWDEATALLDATERLLGIPAFVLHCGGALRNANTSM